MIIDSLPSTFDQPASSLSPPKRYSLTLQRANSGSVRSGSRSIGRGCAGFCCCCRCCSCSFARSCWACCCDVCGENHMEMSTSTKPTAAPSCHGRIPPAAFFAMRLREARMEGKTKRLLRSRSPIEQRATCVSFPQMGATISFLSQHTCTSAHACFAIGRWTPFKVNRVSGSSGCVLQPGCRTPRRNNKRSRSRSQKAMRHSTELPATSRRMES